MMSSTTSARRLCSVPTMFSGRDPLLDDQELGRRLVEPPGVEEIDPGNPEAGEHAGRDQPPPPPEDGDQVARTVDELLER